MPPLSRTHASIKFYKKKTPKTINKNYKGGKISKTHSQVVAGKASPSKTLQSSSPIQESFSPTKIQKNNPWKTTGSALQSPNHSLNSPN
jgi:hypothetical protein